jgi:adenylate cyclase class 2
MSGIEHEIKYRLPDHDRVAELLRRKGTLYTGWHFESNTLYDRDEELISSRRVLRLRRTEEAATLTCKEPVPGPVGLKNRLERECLVSSADEMDGILHILGYRPVLEYEKFRTVWNMPDALVFLDLLPFGHFLEIEGTSAAVDAVVSTLDLSEADPASETYPTLARAWMKKNNQTRCAFSPPSRTALAQALGCRIFVY